MCNFELKSDSRDCLEMLLLLLLSFSLEFRRELGTDREA